MSDFPDPDLTLPPLREVIAAHDLAAKKSLGQNFLLDRNITDKIARTIGDLSTFNVIEIGPGPGGLTRSLLKAGAKTLTAVEFDPRAVAALGSLVEFSKGRLKIIQTDALAFDALASVDGPRIIAANLPYNIATPLTIGWLRQIREHPGSISMMILMYQKEVALRLGATHESKEFGRLSVVAQWLCDVKRQFDLPPSVFVPPPKITSSVVKFTPKSLPDGAPAFGTMEKLTAAAFGQRRKMLRSTLKQWPGILESCGIDGTKRAEDIAVADFVRLACEIERLGA